MDDAHAALPGVLEAVDGAGVLVSAGIPKASFDEVFFRLAEGTERRD